MTDLERLTQTLDALNIHYGQRPFEHDGKQSILVTLDEPRDEDYRPIPGKVPYTGYSGFAWIFTFDTDGTIKEVGGYE